MFEAIIGLQWGDEGKAKFVDERADGCAAVMRFQGGANAGHTVVVAERRRTLHQVPCGALHDGVTCIIGAGCVVDPLGLRAETEALGLRPGRLVVSARAQVVLPWHAAVDAAEESLRGARPVGTTGRGIGPACAAKAGRWGLTVGAFVDEAARSRRWSEVRAWLQAWAAALGLPPPDLAEAAAAASWLRPSVGDDVAAARTAGRRGTVLLEGQLGVMRDPDRGWYPYVTGASVLPPAALVPAGGRVIGVAKPYVTMVGEGPFPTEAPDGPAAALRALGGEYGATTGRPRRCGWLDLPALRYAAGAAGATHLAVAKADLAATLGEVPVCVRYEGWDERRGFPQTHEAEGVRPVYERWSTAGGPLRLAERLAGALGIPLAAVGTGPGRGEGTWLLPRAEAVPA